MSVDRRLLERVIDPLLDNALRYSDGPVTVEVADRGDTFEIAVVDVGPGIFSGDIPGLFERFHPLDGSPARPTGVSLYTGRRLAELMGGRLWCDSKLGVGSRFAVRLPHSRPSVRRLGAAPGAACEHGGRDADHLRPPGGRADAPRTPSSPSGGRWRSARPGWSPTPAWRATARSSWCTGRQSGRGCGGPRSAIFRRPGWPSSACPAWPTSTPSSGRDFELSLDLKEPDVAGPILAVAGRRRRRPAVAVRPGTDRPRRRPPPRP